MRRTARPYPLFYSHGAGSKIVDVDGNAYFDYTLAWGPNILGHPPNAASEAIAHQASVGLTFGAQHDLEYEVAEQLVGLIPCADKVCFGNSGTEIVQVALRLARAATGRTKFLKFEGHYHGWDDSVLVSYHPATEDPMERPVPVGNGQRQNDTAVIAQWNDKDSVAAAFETHRGKISAILCEPLLANSGCIPPDPGFLEFLRDISRSEGALLIFDEVITGFRLGLSGAQGYYGVVPDLATYAKAVGAGLPLSVLAGRAEYLNLIAEGKVVHAGTLNGNPLALAAAKASLDELSRDNGACYRDLDRRGSRLRTELESMLREVGLDVVTAGVGSVFHISFMSQPARNYRDLLAADKQLYSDFQIALLDEGVLALPDGRWYISIAHTDEDVENTLAAARRVMSAQ